MRILAILLFALTASAQGLWTRWEAGPVEVVAEAGVNGPALLAELQAMDGFFARMSGREQPPERPIRVVVFQSEAEYRRYAVARSATKIGYYFQSPERDFLVMTAGRGELRRVALHEFAHLGIRRLVSHLPLWLDEGLAEYYSTLQFGPRAAVAGGDIPVHRRLLSQYSWIEPEEFFRVERGSRYYSEDDSGGLFYSQAWALVHMLMSDQRYRGSSGGVFQLASEGVSGPDILERLYSKTPQQVWSDLRTYLSRPLPQVELAPVPGEPDPPPPVRAELSSVEKTLLLGDLLRQLGRPEEARSLLERLADRNTSGNAQLALGLADDALSRGDREEAKAQYDRAIRLGTREARAWFELALLRRDEGAADPEWVPLLEEALRRNAGYAESAYLLGEEALLDGDFATAIRYLEMAVAARPGRVDLLLHLGRAYHGAGEAARARQMARRAALAASTDSERDQAQALDHLVRLSPEDARPAPRGSRPEVVVTDSWKPPKGDAMAIGTLQELICQGSSAVLVLHSAEGHPLRLLIQDPGKVRINEGGAAKFTFSCGVQTGAPPIRVEYRLRPDSAFSTSGDVVAIEFPQDP